MRIVFGVMVAVLASGCNRSSESSSEPLPVVGAVVAGGVPDADAQVARMRGRFRACYERGLERDPNLAGSVTLDAKIGPAGEVTDVTAGDGRLAPIVPCLKAVVESAKFGAPTGGGASLRIPVTFARQQ
jgi:hypothetical protein